MSLTWRVFPRPVLVWGVEPLLAASRAGVTGAVPAGVARGGRFARLTSHLLSIFNAYLHSLQNKL